MDHAPAVSGFTPINPPMTRQLGPDSGDLGPNNQSEATESPNKGKKRRVNTLVTPPSTAKKPRKAVLSKPPKKPVSSKSNHVCISSQFSVVKNLTPPRSSQGVKDSAGNCRPAAEQGVHLSAKTLDKLALFKYQAETGAESRDPCAAAASGQPHDGENLNHDPNGAGLGNVAASSQKFDSARMTEEASCANGEATMDARKELPSFTNHMDGLLENFGEDSESSEISMDPLLSSILPGVVEADSDAWVSGAKGSNYDTGDLNHAKDIASGAEPKYQDIGHGGIGGCTPQDQVTHTGQFREINNDENGSFVTALTDQTAVHGEEVHQPPPYADVLLESHQNDVDVGFQRTPFPNSPSLKTCGEQMMANFEDFFVDGMDAEEEGVPQTPAVQESFEPPSDLQFPFDENSQTNEVYDPNLQYSSPSPRTTSDFPLVGGKTIYGGPPTTMDAFRKTNNRLSPAVGLSSPCIAVDDTDDVFIYHSAEEDLLDDEIEPEFLDLADRASKATRQTLLAPLPDVPTAPKLQWRSPVTYKSIQSSSPAPLVHFNSSPLPVRRPVSSEPVNLMPSLAAATHISPSPAAASRILLNPAAATHTLSCPNQIVEPENGPEIAKHLVAFDTNGNALPFARPPFPAKVLDRSPILGLSSSPLLRTCFRIGEALNAATVASHTNLDPLIELYARVTYSQRIGVEQYFQFADLFRGDRPPFLNGSYVGWKGVDLWDCDSKYFLGESGKGKIARCVGKLKRDEVNRGSWKIVILSIWEAFWDDVCYVKGIVCS